jgi:hypothetical protein
MAWENRDGRRYYYSGLSINGKTRKTYHGRGKVAEIAAARQAQLQAERADDLDRLRRTRDRYATLDRLLRAFDDVCELMVARTLLVAGFHRANYSSWRPCRVRPAKDV